MVNYSNGKIYKIEPICDHDEGDVYIGSTTKLYLSDRMFEHRFSYRKYKIGYKKYYTSSFDLFDKYGESNCVIYLIETVNANSKQELHAREGFYIKSMKCVNKAVAGRSQKEYKLDNREKLSEKQHLYYIENKEKETKRFKEYRIANSFKVACPCGSSIVKHHFSTHIKSQKHKTYLQNNINNSINEPR